MLFPKSGCAVAALALLVCLSFSSSSWAGNEVENGKIHWRSSYADAVAEAAEESKPLLVKISAVWCGPCRQMQQTTFADRNLINYVDANFIPLTIDADQRADLVAGFHVTTFPTTLVVSPDLKILKRFVAFQSASTLRSGLEQVLRQQSVTTANTITATSAATSIEEVVQPVSAARPINTLKFAFEGFCLVGILDEQKLRRGKPEFSTTYRGQELCFQSERQLKRFLANPAKYWPAADGKCLVSQREGHDFTVGDPRQGVTWRGRLWLFADRDHQQRFLQSPQKYSAGNM